MDGAAGGPGALQGMERPPSTCLTLQKSPGEGQQPLWALPARGSQGASVGLLGNRNPPGFIHPVYTIYIYLHSAIPALLPDTAWGGWIMDG